MFILDKNIIPIQQPLRNCEGCFYENQPMCDNENSPECGLGEWNSWWIWVKEPN